MQKPWLSRLWPAVSVPCLLATLVATSACKRKSPADHEVWADVDGAPIYRDDVERIYRTRLATGAEAASPEQALSFKLNILNELINNQILVAHAAHARITASEAEVDAQVAQLQSAYSPEEFQKKLREQGLSLADLRREVRHDITITKLINKEISSLISVSDKEMTEYYARNKAIFNVPETEYHLAQILVTPVADREVRNLKNDDAKTPIAAERKIQALGARLRAGEDFSTVAQNYSEDPRTAVGGGDMGFVPASALNSNPQLKQAVSALKVNQISGIIRGPDGYHIVKLLGREERGQRPLSDVQVQNAIRQTLRNEKEQLLKAAYIEVLRNRAKVTNYFAEQTLKGQVSPGADR
jgi:peptidyl-prolyl cis-trans isomerase SurA